MDREAKGRRSIALLLYVYSYNLTNLAGRDVRLFKRLGQANFKDWMHRDRTELAQQGYYLAP